MTVRYWDPLYPWSDVVRAAGLLLLLAGTLVLLAAALRLVLRRQRIPGVAAALAALGTTTTAIVFPVIWPALEARIGGWMYFFPSSVQPVPALSLLVPLEIAVLWVALGTSHVLLAFGLFFVAPGGGDGVGAEGEA